MERLVVVTEKDRIEEEDLPSFIRGSSPQARPYAAPSENLSLKEAVERFEIFLIQRALERSGSQREVAKALKVDQATISRKIKKHHKGKNDVFLHNNMK
jgi:transcriptional regulator with PAS, ATPase and Fis domain